ncbi:multiheme c-type cytochrome [Glaciecola sp. SC05]|uniref:multiheme c-type cytochrome n=1 Tax=Glaciecola sp. SC05 TaxID=1987355 RepID=UPI003526D39C
MLLEACLFGILLIAASSVQGAEALASNQAETYQDSISEPTPAVGYSAYTSQDCVACHQSETQHWQKSDHAKAMNLPSKDTVLGNFNNQSAKHFAQEAFFFEDGHQYKATIKDSKDDKGQTFTVKYTFGYDPLQQYLVETDGGRLQVLPFAWDARSKLEGGQRWYHLYTHEVSKQDRLHWRQPLQNWNGMCADCHSDELERNYEPIANTFDTRFSGINVGCVSCHGIDPKVWGKQHPVKGQSSSNMQIDSSLHKAYTKQKEEGYWYLESGNETVSWQGPERDNAFMDNCYACHSLRAPLTDGFKANTAFLDNFTPQFITPPAYYADGQIKEEVYVYGSFLQSKMYREGVNCLDCHDPHTMKLKVEGNGLCLQCHVADTFDTPQHHRHPANTEGAKCVNCHMPDEIYMGVDARRDHSFKIPRPDLSDKFDTPNACVACHSDQSNQWAAQALEAWNGKPDSLSNNLNNLLKLRHGQRISLQDHLLIAYDNSINAITRASAIEMLSQSAGQLLASNLKALVSDSDDLIRLAAARVGNMVPEAERVALLSPLLQDSKKAVRTEAAKHLISLDIASKNTLLFKMAFDELIEASDNSAWRGEGRVNLSNIWLQEGEEEKAERLLLGSTEHDPFFASAYVNLADLYRAQSREEVVAQVLERGMQNIPESADITYSYGLHKVRQKHLSQALDLFARSIELDPQNAVLAYTYVLAIDGLGEPERAISELRLLLPKYQHDNRNLKELGLYLAQKIRSRDDFIWFQQQ